MKTNMSRHDFVLVETVWFILLIAGITATITEGPSNTVAEIGKQVKLNCSGDAPIGYWFFSKNGVAPDEEAIVGPGCSALDPSYGDHYTVESIGGGTTCNLIVFNITMEQAGVYRCLETLNSVFSILTVIDSPAATVNTTEPVVEDEKVVITCSLSYEGSVAPAPTLRPYFFWKDFDGDNVSSSYNSTTENTAVSQLIATAVARYNITPYTCHVYFQLMPPDTAYYANSIPSVNISAMSPTVEVLYGAYIHSWADPKQDITIGGITCEIVKLIYYAYGNPPPTYEFIDTKENVIIGNESTYDLAEIGRTYTCAVQNTVRNEVYRDTHSFTPWSTNIIVPDCKFPRSDTTWISAIPVEGCDNGTCACSSGYDGFNLVCNAKSFPSALYQWIGDDNNANCPRVYDNVTTNGIYRCMAYFDQASSDYTGNYIFPNGTSEKNVTECYQFKGAELPTA